MLLPVQEEFQTNATLKRVGNRVKAVRTEQGELSQEALAREIGVSWITISRLERGVGKSLDLDRLHDIARALRVPVEHLLEDAA